MNKFGVGHFICNCCGCCCQSFTLLISDGLRLCDPSRYLPVIKESLCTGCGQCEQRCLFHAINLDEGIAKIDDQKCMGCGQCSFVCLEKSIEMIEKRKPEFIPKS
ncbi:MAG: 4Fe-4S binding protein [Desulfobacterales bacterium]|nr:4Fe-4S binding protein [Desulfobacterales bacterium]